MRIGSIILTIFVVIAFSWMCSKNWIGKSLVGKGDIITKTIDVEDFEMLSVSGAFKSVEFIQSDRSEVVYEGFENYFNVIEIKDKNGKLEIGYKSKMVNFLSKAPVFTVYGKSLNNIRLSGASNFKSENIENDEEIRISSSGASEVDVKLMSPNVKIQVTGAGKINVEGMTRDLNASITGAAQIKAFDLMSEYTKVNISGAGKAEVYASKSLDIKATGASSVFYKGNPQVSYDTKGASSVKKKE